jgi:replicative DNA helicase
MFIYRDEYYLAQRQPKEMNFDSSDKFSGSMEKWQQDMDKAHNKAELIIAKQRHGPTGTIELFFEGEFTRFGDLDKQHDGGYGD